MTGRVQIETGGRRTYDVPLGLAVQIEELTGQSLTALAVAGPNMRFGHALAIVGKVIEESGARVSEPALIEWAEKVGVAQVVIDAAKILNAFFERPKNAKGSTRGKHPAGTPAEDSP